MALFLARALLPLLAVVMVTSAAPLAGQTTGEEMAVAATGDSNAVDIAKRAKEEIVFGNQQNRGRLGAAKKSEGPSQDQQPQPQAQSQPQPQAQPVPLPQDTAPGQVSEGHKDQANDPEQPSPAVPAADAEDAQEKAEQASSETKEGPEEEKAVGVEDAGQPQGSDQAPAVPENQPTSEGAQEGQPSSFSDQSDSSTEDHQETPQDQPLKSEDAEGDAENEEEEAVQRVPTEGGEHPEAENKEEEKEEEEEEQQQMDDPDLPLLSGLEEGGIHDAPEDAAAEKATADVMASDDDQNSDIADQEDEVESLLTDLQNSNNIQAKETTQETEEEQQKEEEQQQQQQQEEEEEEQSGAEDEGSAERELMEVTSEVAGPSGSSLGIGGQGSSSSSNSGAVDVSSSSSDSRLEGYPQSLLNYILSHGDEYGQRLPYPSDPYYLQRQRRSPATRAFYRLPHIHRRSRRQPAGQRAIRKGDEKALSRAKRTKRDLFNDQLYYGDPDNRGWYYDNDNNDSPLLEREEEEEEEAEKDAELQELLTYLMALYPALYGDPAANGPVQFPGYLWQGPTYPESRDEEEGPYWLVPSGFQEPSPGWGKPEVQPAPAWEPSFYPEEEMLGNGEDEDEEEAVDEDEVEEVPEFYPVLAKRQMMSFVPGERRKRYFFPFAREPYTHWGAFVPSQRKRGGYEDEMGPLVEEEEEEEEDPYRRLRELAMVLAEEDRQPLAPSYFDALDEYKTK